MQFTDSATIGAVVLSALASTFAARRHLLPRVLSHSAADSQDPTYSFGDDQVSRSVRWTFSGATGLSMLVFFLVGAEFGDWLGNVREIVWLAAMCALLLVMLIIIPLLVNFHYFTSLAIRRSYVAACSVGTLGLEGYAFYKIGAVLMGSAPRATAAVEGHGRTLLRAGVLRVALFGILAMALLAGFGAASSLYNLFSSRRIVTEAEQSRAKDNLRWHSELVDVKARTLAKAENRAAGDAGRDWWRDSSENDAVEHARQDLVAVQEEFDGLAADLLEIELQFEDQRRARSTFGLVTRTWDIIFALYCIIRVLQSCVNLSPWRSTEKQDPVTQMIAILVAEGDGKSAARSILSPAAASQVDSESLARGISLLLSLIVVTGSIRACTLVLARWTRALPKVINRRQLVLAFAWLIGAYNVATAVTLCRSLPSRYGRLVLGGLGGFEVDRPLLDGWFDAMFLLGVSATASGLALSRSRRKMLSRQSSFSYLPLTTPSKEIARNGRRLPSQLVVSASQQMFSVNSPSSVLAGETHRFGVPPTSPRMSRELNSMAAALDETRFSPASRPESKRNAQQGKAE
ncbi:hypothetical protein PYCC9005_000578 [Savitreella phatthalungensis]